MELKNCEPCFKAIERIKDFLTYRPSVFSQMLEMADAYNGCLGDYILLPMEALDGALALESATYCIERAFYGYQYTARGVTISHRPAFNPNDDFFYFNGYGNLVSVPQCLRNDYYSLFLDRDHIIEIYDAWRAEVFAKSIVIDRLFAPLTEFVI